MGIVVTKFGGSSLSEASQFRKVKEILLGDSNRMYVVPSAPGRREPDDAKVTDMLYTCHKLASKGSWRNSRRSLRSFLRAIPRSSTSWG